MGHTIIVAAGVVINLDPANSGDFDLVEETFEAHLQALKAASRNRISSYYSPYNVKDNDFYILRGTDGYDSTTKAYLFSTKALVWTETIDGSNSAYFQDGTDGLNDPQTFIEKIQHAQEEAKTSLEPLVAKLGLEEGKWKVEIIPYSKNYE